MPVFFKKKKEISFYQSLGNSTESVYRSLNAYMNNDELLGHCSTMLNRLIQGMEESVEEGNTVDLPALKTECMSGIEFAMKSQSMKIQNIVNNLLMDMINTGSAKKRQKKLMEWIDLAEKAQKHNNYPVMQIWMQSYLFSRNEFWKSDLLHLSGEYFTKIEHLNQLYPKDQGEFKDAFYKASTFVPLIEIINTLIVYTFDVSGKQIIETLSVLRSIKENILKSFPVTLEPTGPAPEINPIDENSFDLQKNLQIASLIKIFSKDEIPPFRLTEQSLFKECRKVRAKKDMASTLQKMNSLLELHGEKGALSPIENKCREYIEARKEFLEYAQEERRMTI